MAACACNSSVVRERQTLRVHWPTSLAEMGGGGLQVDSVSKYKIAGDTQHPVLAPACSEKHSPTQYMQLNISALPTPARYLGLSFSICHWE